MRAAASWVGRLVAGLLLSLSITLGAGAETVLAASPAPHAATPAAAATPSPSAPAVTPLPSPAVTTPPPAEADDDPAWYDIPGQIRKGITDLLSWVAETGLRPVMESLGSTILATPDMTDNPRVDAVRNTFLIIANTCFVLFVVFAGYVLVTKETLHNRYGLKELLPRLVIGFAAANLSGLLCTMMIKIANAVTAAIVGSGVNGPSAATALEQALTGGITTGGASANGFLLALLVIAALVMALVVVITWFVRLAMLLLLVGIAPAALACHGLPQTEGLAYAWWRSMIAVNGIQIAQAAVLLAMVKVFLTPDGPVINGMPATASGLLGVCMAISMLWLMIKIPGWMKHFVMGPLRGRGAIAQVIQTVAAVKTLGWSQAGRGRPVPVKKAGRSAAAAAPPTPTSRSAWPTAWPTAATTAPTARPASQGVAQPQFSHSPVTQAAWGRPAGVAQAQFSHPTPTPPVGRTGTTQPTFSHPATTASPAPRPAAAPGSALFSNAPTATPLPPRSRPAPAVAFSHPAQTQSSAKRPPAPVTPVFSDPPPKPRPKPAPSSSGKKKT